MKRLILTGAALLLGLQLGLPGAVSAASPTPPPPPPPPPCRTCSGPPPPPTPVPTLAPAPTQVVQQVVVGVSVSPTHVARGHSTTIAVSAASNAAVTVEIAPKSGKHITLKGKVGNNGTLMLTWKVPKKLALGRAKVTVTVEGSSKPYVTSVQVVILRNARIH